MWKAALVGTAALALIGSSLVYAQQFGRPNGFDRPRPNLEDMRAFADARIAALHAGLELTPDQEKNWPPFEQAAREMAKLRLDRITAAVSARRDRQPQSNDPADRLHRRAAAMTETGAALKKVADAVDPLYKVSTMARSANSPCWSGCWRPARVARRAAISAAARASIADVTAMASAGSTADLAVRTFRRRAPRAASSVFSPYILLIARRSYPQPPDTIADAWEPPGSRPAAFLLGRAPKLWAGGTAGAWTRGKRCSGGIRGQRNRLSV